ncbi:unnamed protein product [Somion occarium]|uniref:Uncharacterized protein n=1 Tax=Somion occarium TaxID=3059160 RepID=A0ABP1CXG1_9APHY
MAPKYPKRRARRDISGLKNQGGNVASLTASGSTLKHASKTVEFESRALDATNSTDGSLRRSRAPSPMEAVLDSDEGDGLGMGVCFDSLRPTFVQDEEDEEWEGDVDELGWKDIESETQCMPGGSHTAVHKSVISIHECISERSYWDGCGMGSTKAKATSPGLKYSHDVNSGCCR